MALEGQNQKTSTAAILIPAGLFICSAMLALAGGSAAPAAPLPRAQGREWSADLPDGEGKKLIVEKCQICHSLERVVTSRRGKDDWQAVIDLMVEEGAPLTDDESKTVVNYLAANYGPKGAMRAAPPAASAPSMIVDPDQTQFLTPPDSLGLPAGVQVSMLSGDLAKPGLFSALFKLSDDQKIDPHWLSADLNLVVLRGTYELGNGDAYDAGKLQPVSAGEVVLIPAQSHHFGHAKGATVFLVYGVGPLSVTWVSKTTQ